MTGQIVQAVLLFSRQSPIIDSFDADIVLVDRFAVLVDRAWCFRLSCCQQHEPSLTPSSVYSALP